MIPCCHLLMFSLLTLNVNGIHDSKKWPKVWQFLKYQCADIFCLQETHLQSNQEYAFGLYGQNYELFFSHGSSNSAGVLIGVCQNKGITNLSAQCVDGHLQTVDIYYQNITYRIINVYVPCEAWERKSWFDTVVPFVIPGSTFVLGDFNTVHTTID